MKVGKNDTYSISKKLQKDNRTTDEFEIMINSLTLEEVIALKLELSTRSLRGKFYGFPIWKSLPELTRDAVLKYALSATRSKKEAARFLGISVSELNKNLKIYKNNIIKILEDNDIDKLSSHLISEYTINPNIMTEGKKIFHSNYF